MQRKILQNVRCQPLRQGDISLGCDDVREICADKSSMHVAHSVLTAPNVSDDGWVLVSTSKNYTPCELDVGHCLQLRVLVRCRDVCIVHLCENCVKWGPLSVEDD